jgi:hypothetical protein
VGAGAAAFAEAMRKRELEQERDRVMAVYREQRMAKMPTVPDY